MCDSGVRSRLPSESVGEPPFFRLLRGRFELPLEDSLALSFFGSAGRDVEFGSVSNKHSAFFENLAGEFNLHADKCSIKAIAESDLSISRRLCGAPETS